MTITTLPIAQLRKDPRIQQRTEIDQAVVELYVEAIAAGDQFPPLVAFFDGTAHWLTAGFHREAAYQAADVAEAQVDVREGTVRDAILFAVGDNATHGKQRSNEDKRRAVMTLLEDAEWAAWSDREIAKQCRVGHATVSRMRASLSQRDSDSRTYTTRHGTQSTMATGNIGRQTEAEAPAQVAERDAPAAAAPPPPPADAPTPAAPPPDPDEPEDDGPSANELADAQGAEEDQRAALQLLMQADDKLAAAHAEILRQAAEIRVLRARVQGLTNEAGQAARLTKMWRLKYEKLQREGAAA